MRRLVLAAVLVVLTPAIARGQPSLTPDAPAEAKSPDKALGYAVIGFPPPGTSTPARGAPPASCSTA
jgi:hypothetical protein